MPEEKKFYNVLDGLDALEPGKKMVISHTLTFWGGSADLAALVGLSANELVSMQEESITKEKQVYEKLRKATGEWEEQGAQTLLLEKALEYVRTAEVKHTSNEWKRGEGGTWTISNRTYVMWYRLSEESRGGPWRVFWGLDYNVPLQPKGDYNFQFTGESIEIAGQNKKGYPNQEAAQKYIQGRFDLYAHLFTELSPPIPEKQKRMFSVNGHLLPGYTLEVPVSLEPDKNAVADLLSCLGDEDIAPTAPKAEADKAPAQKPTQHRHKNSAPAR